jgi:uncharacterized membrane protein
LSELAPRKPNLPAQRENTDHALGTMVYGLYLAAPLTLGVSGLAGALVAGKRKGEADPVAASHYRYQLWTFGAAAFAIAAGGLWALLGGVGSVGGRGGDDAWLALSGLALSGTAGLAYLAATVYGLSRILSRSPIGRLVSR